jgi:hypothetical protein
MASALKDVLPPSHGMAIHDDLAAIGKLDFEYAACSKIKIQISTARLKPLLNPVQRRP